MSDLELRLMVLSSVSKETEERPMCNETHDLDPRPLR